LAPRSVSFIQRALRRTLELECRVLESIEQELKPET